MSCYCASDPLNPPCVPAHPLMAGPMLSTPRLRGRQVADVLLNYLQGDKRETCHTQLAWPTINSLIFYLSGLLPPSSSIYHFLSWVFSSLALTVTISNPVSPIVLFRDLHSLPFTLKSHILIGSHFRTLLSFYLLLFLNPRLSFNTLLHFLTFF